MCKALTYVKICTLDARATPQWFIAGQYCAGRSSSRPSGYLYSGGDGGGGGGSGGGSGGGGGGVPSWLATLWVVRRRLSNAPAATAESALPHCGS